LRLHAASVTDCTGGETYGLHLGEIMAKNNGNKKNWDGTAPGLFFLKFISGAFEGQRVKAAALRKQRADPEDRHVLTPGRYAEVEDDGEPFEEQFSESARLEGEIRENLRRIGYGFE
jgi:hypothetical protein